MKSAYLTGVIQKSSSFPKVFILGNGTDTWYAASYNDVKTNSSTKKEIVNLTNRLTGTHTTLNDWEWHHVVETQHLSHIITSSLHQEEWYHMPTVLISKKEHRFLSQNFNNNAFRELATIGKGRRSSSSNDRIRGKSEKDKRLAKINNLQMMYHHAYSRYPTFRKIANNVFTYHLTVIT